MYGYCPLASGSQGNAIFFGTKNTRLIIDAGISLRALEKKLGEISVSLNDIDAILITHEHTDHIRGLSTLSARYNIPIFANSDTAKAISDILGETFRFKIFSTGEIFEFGDLTIKPFSIQHDTLDPVAFTLQTENLKVGICADLGFVTSLVKNELTNCDYLYIEANHEPSMVHASRRPQVYKQRVLGRQGHLSNNECASLLESIYHPGLKHIHLAHLSQECNNPELALKTVKERLSQLNAHPEVSIAFQDIVSQPVLFTQSI